MVFLAPAVADVGESLPKWVPQGYDITDEWVSPDKRFAVYAIYSRRNMKLGIVDRKTQGVLLLRRPNHEELDAILKADFQVDATKAFFRSASADELRWGKNATFTVVYEVESLIDDPRFYHRSLKLTRVFRCGPGPTLEEVEKPKVEIMWALGYGPDSP